jgi:hypothetical protein
VAAITFTCKHCEEATISEDVKQVRESRWWWCGKENAFREGDHDEGDS